VGSGPYWGANGSWQLVKLWDTTPSPCQNCRPGKLELSGQEASLRRECRLILGFTGAIGSMPMGKLMQDWITEKREVEGSYGRDTKARDTHRWASGSNKCEGDRPLKGAQLPGSCRKEFFRNPAE